MKTKVLYILLGLSVIFNFAFAGGFLEARSRYEPPEDGEAAPGVVAEELDLTAAQREKFAELRGRTGGRVRELHESILSARQELYALLAADTPDTEAVRAVEERIAEQHRELNRLRLDSFREFMDSLTPPQREEVRRRMQGRPLFQEAQRRLLERFDEDGDGQLSPRERGRAVHQLRSDRERLHQEILRRFDLDGDGVLNLRERGAATRAARRQLLGPGRQGPGAPPNHGPGAP